MAGIQIEEKDLGLNELLKSLQALGDDKHSLFMGVQFPDRAYDDGTLVGDVGLAHEFGWGNTPASGWIRSTFERNKNKYLKIIEKDIKRAVDKGKILSAKSLFLSVGPVVGKDLKASIVSFGLIDTGLLLRSVGWRIAKDDK